MAGGAASHLSRGGMTTKIEAGKIATKSGTAMIVTKGTEPHPLAALEQGARHTLFAATQIALGGAQALDSRLARRLRHHPVDAGAVRALESGKSLLPIGVTRVKGDFSRGDAVSIVGPDGNRDRARPCRHERRRGQYRQGQEKPGDRSKWSGVGNRAEMVHADNLALLSAKWGGGDK